MSNQLDILHGTIDRPDGWELRTEISLLEPKRSGLSVPLTLRSAPDAPRANLVVNERESSGRDIAEDLDDLLRTISQGVKGLHHSEAAEFVFADGVVGLSIRLSYLIDELAVAQLHVFRGDADRVTHFVGTASATEPERMAVLERLIRSYRR